MLVEEIGGHHFDSLQEMLDSFVAVMAGPADYAYHLVALGEKELRQIGAILAGDAGDESFRHGRSRCEVVSCARAR
jgi:hypothetical protein